MLLVDTSVWIDHLHASEPRLVRALEDAQVAQHPLVVGELALGTLRARDEVLALVSALPAVPQASHEEMLHLVETHRLHGRGLGVVDAHLLASLRLAHDVGIWTRDKRLRAAAEELAVRVAPS